MKRYQRRPDRVVHAGGREFRLFKEYDDSLKEEILKFPDFDESPEYTIEGRPFATSAQESCEYGKSGEPDGPCDCGGCGWFFREAPYDPIGVCMRGERKRALPIP